MSLKSGFSDGLGGASYMHDVVPIVVTMAVRIVMMISTTRFKVNLFMAFSFLMFEV